MHNPPGSDAGGLVDEVCALISSLGVAPGLGVCFLPASLCLVMLPLAGHLQDSIRPKEGLNTSYKQSN